jgi:hypothetical protein
VRAWRSIISARSAAGRLACTPRHCQRYQRRHCRRASGRIDNASNGPCRQPVFTSRNVQGSAIFTVRKLRYHRRLAYLNILVPAITTTVMNGNAEKNKAKSIAGACSGTCKSRHRMTRSFL